MTSHATICIPSNRTLIESVEALWSAINYAQLAGMQVVISDNSGDPDKRDYFSAAPEHVTYISNGPPDASRNVLSALSQATTDFVLLLGDDDFITLADGARPFDFSRVPLDHVGVKPRIEVWSKERGVSTVDDFPIEAADAAGRIIEYNEKVRKANSTYYSFFRRRPLTDIYTLFVEHHPLAAGYSDWGIVYALVADGRMLHDPGSTLRYNNSRWDDLDVASTTLEKLHAAAGLPPQTRAYMLMLHYMDAYVLILRQNSGMALIERYKAAFAVAMVFLKRLLFRVGQTPSLYEPESDLLTALKAQINSSDPDLDQVFHISGLITDRLKPGLKAAYDRYLLASVRGGQPQ